MKQRFRKEKYETDVINTELFKKWKKEYPEFKLNGPEFKKYLLLIIEEYINEALTNPFGVRFPFYMGDLDLKFIPMKERSLNPSLLHTHGIEVPNLNFSTNGREGKVVFSAEHSQKFNKYLPLVGFAPSTPFKKRAKQQFKESPELFRENVYTKLNRENFIKDNKK